jgi:hypothetical protein
MNILIVGEYSGYAKNLKSGFTKLGHSSTIISDGNNVKKLDHDLDDVKFRFARTFYFKKYPLPLIKFFSCLLNTFILNFKVFKLKKSFDLIIIVNAEFIFESLFEDVGVFFILLKLKQKNNSKVILSCCSYDPAFYEYQYILKYSPFISNSARVTQKYFSSKHKKLFKRVVKSCNIIVPTEYIYSACINRYLDKHGLKTKLNNCIAIPFDTSNIDLNYEVNSKIHILHGVISGQNRFLLKGSNHIMEALEMLESKYSDLVELILPQNLSYNEYYSLFHKVDIVLDQVYSYGLGVNGAMALANGKVLLGGNEIEYNQCCGFEKMPVINIIPDSNQIFLELEKLILDKERIVKYKKESRTFAEEHLDCKVIAQKYIDLL